MRALATKTHPAIVVRESFTLRLRFGGAGRSVVKPPRRPWAGEMLRVSITWMLGAEVILHLQVAFERLAFLRHSSKCQYLLLTP